MWLLWTIAAAAPLDSDGACVCFEGESRGNDRVDVDLSLCRNGPAITGTFTFVADRAGSGRRTLGGEAVPGGLLLRDLSRPSGHPEPPWHFCKIRRYELSWTEAGGLRGTSRSPACADRSVVELTPVSCGGEAPKDDPRLSLDGARYEARYVADRSSR